MRLEGISKAGFYPTPPVVVEAIANLCSLSTGQEQDHVFRVIDPCCGEGAAVAQFRDMLNTSRMELYGIELHKERAELAKTCMDRVLLTDFFHTTIQNNTFSCLWLNPPYDHNDEAKRLEHKFLLQATRCLSTYDGLLIYIVPQHVLKVSARYLSSHYETPTIYRFPDPHYDIFKQVVLFARRKGIPGFSAYSHQILEEAHYTDLPPLPTEELYSFFYLPLMREDPDLLFLPRYINPLDAVEEARKQGLWTHPSVQHALWPHTEDHVQPLMPLRQGHLALLTAAGFMNNLCLENTEGEKFMVKGHTRKRHALVSSEENKQILRDKLQTTVTLLNLKTGLVTEVK